MTDTPPDPAPPEPAVKPRTQDASYWKFKPPAPGTGPRAIPPRPMRFDPATAANLRAAAVKPEPEPDGGADDTDNGPQVAAEAPEATTAGEDICTDFTAAFRPDDGGGFTASEYQALAAEFEDSAEGEPDDDGEPASKREARYRIRAKEAETRLADAAAENASLLDRVAAMQQAEAVRLASDRLADPAGDLFREHGIDEVIADDGTVSAERVNELVDGILGDHPHYGIRKPPADLNRLKSGAGKPDESAPPSWTRAFAPPPT